MKVAGPRLAKPGNYLLPFGADVAETMALAECARDRVIVMGSAMSGRQPPPGAVVGPGVNELLSLQPPRGHLPTQCIRCGWCSDNCPARLNVAALNDDFELARAERAKRRGALACVGCGICSYVCPARLPLRRRLGLLQQAIRTPQQAQHAATGTHEETGRGPGAEQ